MDLKQQVELTFTRIEEILNKLKNLSTATVTVIEENDVTNITTKLDTVKASTDLLLTDITSMKTELESLENEISSIDTAIDNNSTDITAILSATATLKTDIENITTNLSELAKDCSNYYSIVGSDAMQARDNSEANRQKLNDIAIDLNNIGFDITDIANGTGTLLGENEEIKSNLSTLQILNYFKPTQTF